MIQRRSLLALLLGSPMFSSQVEVSQLGVAPIDTVAYEPNMPSPFNKALNKARSDFENRQQSKCEDPKYFAYDIADKRSWSRAFKSHVHYKRKMEQGNLWNMSDDELLIFFAKRGIKVIS